MAVASWVFGSLLLLFYLWLFIRGPEALPQYKHRQLALLGALLAALFAFFIAGNISVGLTGTIGAGGSIAVQSVGGLGVFVLVLWWWYSDFARVKPAPNDAAPDTKERNSALQEIVPSESHVATAGPVTGADSDQSSSAVTGGKEVSKAVSTTDPVRGTTFNRAALRRLIDEAFDDEGLRVLCADNFPAVYQQFTAGQGKTDRILRLIAYAEQRNRVGELLAAIQRERPEKYAEYESQAGSAPSAPVPADKRDVLWQLINASFNVDDLRTFCFRHFPAVHNAHTNQQGKQEWIIGLLDHAERHGEVPRLLGLIEQANPTQYARFAAQL
jgi:hypothetical protein